MKKMLVLAFATAFVASPALAQDSTGQARLLVCESRGATATIPTCGGVRPGCQASVTSNKKTTKYKVLRTKNADGSLTYSTRAGAKPSCIIGIGPLRYGIRPVTRSTCAKALVGAKCSIIDVDPDATPSPTATAAPTATK